MCSSIFCIRMSRRWRWLLQCHTFSLCNTVLVYIILSFFIKNLSSCRTISLYLFYNIFFFLHLFLLFASLLLLPILFHFPTYFLYLKVELGIADPKEEEWKDDIAQRILLRKGDSFFVPPGNIYRWDLKFIFWFDFFFFSVTRNFLIFSNSLFSFKIS